VDMTRKKKITYEGQWCLYRCEDSEDFERYDCGPFKILKVDRSYSTSVDVTVEDEEFVMTLDGINKKEIFPKEEDAYRYLAESVRLVVRDREYGLKYAQEWLDDVEEHCGTEEK
jgi:hypothetical protein